VGKGLVVLLGVRTAPSQHKKQIWNRAVGTPAPSANHPASAIQRPASKRNGKGKIL